MRPVAIATQLERGEGETRGKNSFLILFRRIIALVYYIGIYNNSIAIYAYWYMHPVFFSSLNPHNNPIREKLGPEKLELTEVSQKNSCHHLYLSPGSLELCFHP